MTETISIIAPVYNEDAVLEQFHSAVKTTIEQTTYNYEIVFINDGSSDNSLAVLEKLRATDDHVAIVNLSRNFGKEAAMTAGLDYAKGDAVIVIDADLQDPPALIPEFILQWKAGYDVVYGQRISRDGETALKRFTAWAFYNVLEKLSDVAIPKNTGDFRLLSRRAVDAVKSMREQHRYMKGLFAWVGFPQKAIKYERAPRAAGQSKWSYWKLWNFALEAITSFSTIPLKLSTYIGAISALAGFGFGIYVIVYILVFGNPTPGYPSLMCAVLFLGGLQMIMLGMIGEYLARNYNESKNRPVYFVDEFHPGKILNKD